jgi:hypothetical protein
MTNDEKFKFFFDETVSVYESFVRVIISISVSLLLIVGWFVSDKAGTAVKEPTLRFLCLGGLALTAGIEFFIMMEMKKAFANLGKILGKYAKQAGFNRTHYKHRIFDPPMIFSIYAFHVSLLVILAWMILKHHGGT